MLKTRTLAIISALIFVLGTGSMWYYYQQRTKHKDKSDHLDIPETHNQITDKKSTPNKPPVQDGEWNDGIDPIIEQPEVIENFDDNNQNQTTISDNNNEIFFDFDESRIKDTELTKLEYLADFLKKNSSVDVLIEGHCDERGSDEYNRALGERRAIAVQYYLIELGVEQNRIHTLSLGEELAKQDAAADHQQFRKAVTKFIDKEAQGSSF